MEELDTFEKLDSVSDDLKKILKNLYSEKTELFLIKAPQGFSVQELDGKEIFFNAPSSTSSLSSTIASLARNSDDSVDSDQFLTEFERNSLYSMNGSTFHKKVGEFDISNKTDKKSSKKNVKKFSIYASEEREFSGIINAFPSEEKKCLEFGRPFSHQLIISEDVVSLPQSEPIKKPELFSSSTISPSYLSSVSQPSHLKVRWMPLGAEMSQENIKNEKSKTKKSSKMKRKRDEENLEDDSEEEKTQNSTPKTKKRKKGESNKTESKTPVKKKKDSEKEKETPKKKKHKSSPKQESGSLDVETKKKKKSDETPKKEDQEIVKEKKVNKGEEKKVNKGEEKKVNKGEEKKVNKGEEKKETPEKKGKKEKSIKEKKIKKK